MGAPTVYEVFAEPVVFASYFFKDLMFNKMPEFHKTIYEALKQRRPRQVIVAPRGTAKSTIVTLIWTLYNVCFGLASLIVIASETWTKACIHLDRIKDQVLNNSELRNLFKIQPSEPWTKSDIAIATPFNRVRILALGNGQSVRGIVKDKRIELFIGDDLESNATAYRKTPRENLKKWFWGEVIPAIEPITGKVIVVGTNLHPQSLIADLLKLNEWNPLLFKLIQDDGTSLWEDRFPLNYILKIKNSYIRAGRLADFYAEYMNDPMLPLEESLDLSYVRYFDKWTLKKKVIYYAAVDPAASLETDADNTAIAVLGHDEEGNVYLFEVVAEKMLPSKIIDHLIRISRNYPLRKIGIEVTGMQKALFNALDEELRSRGEFLPLVPIKVTGREGSKKERILGYLEPKISNGRFFIDPTCHDHREFLDEFKRFLSGEAEHDDRVDAVSLAVSLMENTLYQKPAEEEWEPDYELLNLYLP